MPFGAEVAGGGARFRLWAPACDKVTLRLGRDGGRRVAMQRRAGGWYRAEVGDAAPGTAYAFEVDGGDPVADPASRSNPWGVNGPSAIVDPNAFEWTDEAWIGRPWHEAVVYELHIGTFTREGTFASAISKLDHLAQVGITALEVMPVAAFAGERNWGYDGVLPFAPAAAYGTPEDFKRFISSAHARGIMVLLDVVYNHFGPEGNHITRYAPQFMNDAHHTPWGAAMNFDGPDARGVRDFFVHNALYWVEEFHLDGLRLDAVHAMMDDSKPHIVREIAQALREGPGSERHVHLVLENERNEARLLDRRGPHATAQWNDDWHHCAHVLITGETDGYYGDFAKRPGELLARAFAEGFAYQGEPMPRSAKPRGEPSAALPYEAFMPFLQNHDQVGNRAMGERLCTTAPPESLRLATAALLLAPQVPLVFMGEEVCAQTPFLYFCDFHGELADAVREGRRKEFAAFPRFESGEARASIPDPNAETTFLASKIAWDRADRDWLAFFAAMLELRATHLVPRLQDARGARYTSAAPGRIGVDWTLGDGSRLHLRANFSAEAAPAMKVAPGKLLHSEGRCDEQGFGPWSGAWTLEAAR